MLGELQKRILNSLEENPRTVAELAVDFDEGRDKILETVNHLEEKNIINVYKIGNTVTCVLNDNAETYNEKPLKKTAADTKEAKKNNKREAEEKITKKDKPKTVGIVSGKGGVGKTVVTINLGTAMIELNEKTIVMDADTEMSNLGLHLGMYTYPNSLREVVNKGIHIMSALHVDKDSGLRVLPTSLSAEPINEDVRKAIDMIPSNYTVLIDSPPGYQRPIERVIDISDELIFVTAPEIPAVTDTFKLAEEARRRDKKILGAVINMYSSYKDHLSIKEVEKALEMPILGTIEKTDLVQRSLFEHKPVVSMKPYAKISRSFKKLASEISGKEYNETFFDRIKGVFS